MKSVKLRRETLRILASKQLMLVAGARIDISDVIGGCETNHCRPGPADDGNGIR